uniref:Reverse transcriptase domain-containing protein n=1 Tax=Lactuca sativa TaxID=4236 RepID=A0A9R1WQ03_LACSA|nr:hypothetical protein LSAT_V11C900498490 [Lactuca sativa]
MSLFIKIISLVNYSPRDKFQISKSVRDGDPLSPFVFILTVEGLSVAIKSSCENLLLCGINLPNYSPSISHLFYVDEALCRRMECNSPDSQETRRVGAQTRRV